MTNTHTSDAQSVTLGDLQDRVLKVIATTKRLPRESVSLDSSFESLGIDSLDRLNILFDLESEFDIQINDEDAKRVETIRQMVAGVALLVNGESASAAVAPPGDTSLSTPETTAAPNRPETRQAAVETSPSPLGNTHSTKPASSGS